MSAKGSELKRVRQSLKRNLRNKQYKSQLRTALKNVLTAGSKEEAENILPSSLSIFDKVARKGIIHKNKAANQKSRMMRHIASL
tara:strand:+ start:369 stop:620 length:252 start_codon:yes stop_codon:yes gene_type:complete